MCVLVCVGVCWCVVVFCRCVWLCVVVCVVVVCRTHSQDHLYTYTYRCTCGKLRSREHFNFHTVRSQKSLTIHNGFTVFLLSRSCVKHFSGLQAAPLFKIKEGLKARKVFETDSRSKKTSNHCGRSRASRSRHHGK